MTRDRIVSETRAFIGTPYHHRASAPGLGCDCLGLVLGVWRNVYGRMPEAPPAYGPGFVERRREELLADAARRHLSEVPVASFAAGDLLLFRWRAHLPAGHAGIATSPSTMVHAQQHASVCEVAISPWWRRHLSHAFAFPGLER